MTERTTFRPEDIAVGRESRRANKYEVGEEALKKFEERMRLKREREEAEEAEAEARIRRGP